jgi:hypothetical protein
MFSICYFVTSSNKDKDKSVSCLCLRGWMTKESITVWFVTKLSFFAPNIFKHHLCEFIQFMQSLKQRYHVSKPTSLLYTYILKRPVYSELFIILHQQLSTFIVINKRRLQLWVTFFPNSRKISFSDVLRRKFKTVADSMFPWFSPLYKDNIIR